MGKVSYTEEEYNEFSDLLDGTESIDQVTRISARLNMQKFVKVHGKEKCDDMFELLK